MTICFYHELQRQSTLQNFFCTIMSIKESFYTYYTMSSMEHLFIFVVFTVMYILFFFFIISFKVADQLSDPEAIRLWWIILMPSSVYLGEAHSKFMY